jgi:hypothetical protein
MSSLCLPGLTAIKMQALEKQVELVAVYEIQKDIDF